jgi:hypothetical protein
VSPARRSLTAELIPAGSSESHDRAGMAASAAARRLGRRAAASGAAASGGAPPAARAW